MSSNLIQVAIKNYLSGEIDYNRRYGGGFFGLIKAIAMIHLKDFKSFWFETLQGTSSNLIQVAIKNYLSGEIDYNLRYGGEFFGLIKALAMIRFKDFKSFGFETLRGTSSNLIQVAILIFI